MAEKLETSNCERVLLVEDTPDAMTTYKGILEDRGLRVLTASSAEEAKNILRKGKIHRIVTDSLGKGWISIVEEVQKAESPIPIKIISNTYEPEADARRLKIPFIHKSKIDFETL